MTLTPGKVVLSNPLTCTNTPKGENKLYSDAKGVVPSLDLRFAEGKNLNDYMTGQNLITFSRSSIGTYVDENGIIQTATADTPRFDHDPTTRESLGLLIEESRTNLLQYSKEIDNNYWNKSGIQPFGSGSVANATTAPDGTETADLIKEDTTTASHYVRREANLAVASTKYAYSVYVKNIDIDYVTLSFRGSPNNYASATFNLTGSGSLSSSAAVGAGFAVDTTNTKIFDVGNGWFRCVLTFTAGSSVSSQSFFIALSDNGVLTSNGITSYAGTEASLYLWGAQLEAGSFPTSYIPTTGTALTRSADVASITGSNFSGFYNQSEGTIFGDYGWTVTAKNLLSTAVGTGTNGNNGLLRAVGTTVPIPRIKQAIGLTNFSAGNTATPDNQISYLNGSLGGTPAAIFSPTYPPDLQIGRQQGSSLGYLNGYVARLTYFPERLPDSSLQTMTTP